LGHPLGELLEIARPTTRLAAAAAAASLLLSGLPPPYLFRGLPTSSCYAPPAAAFRLLGSRAPYLKKPRSALSLSDLLDAGFSLLARRCGHQEGERRGGAEYRHVWIALAELGFCRSVNISVKSRFCIS